jgi:formylglycine-generating enzyme required for sulfatase activity
VQSEREARKALVQAWAACEGLSQKVTVTLEPWAQGDAPPQAYRDALSILAQLYHNRLLEARVARNLPEIEAFRNLLARADRIDHAFAAELADQATVRIDGQPTGAAIMARPVQEGADTRLVPVGDPRPIEAGKAIQLDAGTWQFVAGDTTITWVLRPDHATAIAWPKELKQLPDLPLRYVPADLHLDATGQPAGLKPFQLGVTEVTVGQYLAFLKDPEIFAQVRKGFKAAMEAAAAAGEKFNLADAPKSPFVPYNDNGTPAYVELRGNRDGNDLVDIAALGGATDLPVARITRNDAEAFCQWLSKKNGCKARLPLKAEWQFAAGGDDVQRVYPWGPHFDGNFAACSAVQLQRGAVPVRQVAADVGPFGHLGLGGDVREWLGVRPLKGDARAAGAYLGLIAGGAWSDDDEHWFRTGYVESVDPGEIRSPAIGFRVLVEVQ